MSGPLLSNVKDVELWANTKLAGDWSAPGVVSQIDQPKLQMLGTVFSKGKLDQLVKVRLLIACLLLPKTKKADLAPELEELARAACNDDDEWVRVMGCSVGDFHGQLNLEAVMKENPMVDETMKTIWSQLAEAQPPASFMPLQELYFHPDIRTVQQHSSAEAPAPEDFRPRDPPEGVAGLPDFSIEALHGGLPGGQLLASGGRGGSSSVHARRGSGLSGTGMFISSKSLGLPQKIQTPRAAPGQLVGVWGGGLPGTGSAAAAAEGAGPGPGPDDSLQRHPLPAHPLPAGALQRPAKRVALGPGEASALQRSGSGSGAAAAAAQGADSAPPPAGGAAAPLAQAMDTDAEPAPCSTMMEAEAEAEAEAEREEGEVHAAQLGPGAGGARDEVHGEAAEQL